ncbi:MAG TPA: protein kinase [Bryobacteraceae bacterium]|nr:protein kinase [Bryobacteraceae bacterium]
MTDWKRVEDLFLAAGALPEGERRGFLRAACDGDSQLIGEVESLLAHDVGTGPLTDIVRRGAVDAIETAAFAGRRVGSYRIAESLGHGGMGSVYLAVRADDQYSKKVAIKFIRTGMNAPGTIDRFLRERQILANLDHPYIAKLLDGGTTEEGVPYFVMEYVAGTPVDEYCERERLNIEARCDMFRRICEAVGCAHRNLIIHRDLKPANILVNAAGLPILLDFGIAKLLDAGQRTDSGLTAGPWMLTPDYASPEQVRGRPTTTASDIYSLGIVLYQLLTGAKPYHVDSTKPLEIERAICEQPPPRPSSVRGDRKLKGDLDNIVLMALRKEPERRYNSAEQFSEDVRRYLRGLPVIARDDTFGYRAGKFIRRHRAAVPIASVALAALIAATAITAHEAKRAEQARAAAETQRALAVRQRQRAEQARIVAARASAAATAHAQEADVERQRAEKRLGELMTLGKTSLFHVQDTLERMPGALDARREVIEATVRYLDGLAAESKDDPALLDLLGSGYTQVGDVLGFPGRPNLGDREGALVAWRKARAIFTRMERMHPGDLSAELQDLGIHQRIGIVTEAVGDMKDAIAEYRAALAIALRVAKRNPKEPNIVSQPGIIDHNLGLALLKIKDPSGKAYIVDEVRVYEAATAMSPKSPELPRGLASAYGNLAHALTGEGDLAGALAELKKSEAIRDRLRAEMPNDALVKSGVASGYERMGILLGAPWQPSMGDRTGAMEYMSKALPLRTELYLVDTGSRKAKTDFAASLAWSGAIEPDPAVALPLLRRAVTMLGELRIADPKLIAYGEQFALAQEYIGNHLAAQGDLAGAIAAYKQSVGANGNAAVGAKLADCERRLEARN